MFLELKAGSIDDGADAIQYTKQTNTDFSKITFRNSATRFSHTPIWDSILSIHFSG